MAERKVGKANWGAGRSYVTPIVFCWLAVVTAQPVFGSGLAIGLNPVHQAGTGFSSTASDALLASLPVGTPGFELEGRFWNNLRRSDVGYAQHLKDSSNANVASSGVYALWRSPGTSAFVLPWPGGTVNYKLMWGNLAGTDEANDAPLPADFFTRSANQPLIYIRGLSAWLAKSGQPAGVNSYSVLVYVDDDGTDRIAEYWLQRVPPGSSDPPAELELDLTPHVFVRDDGTNFDSVFARISASADTEGKAATGNYILWSGLTADRFVVRTEARSSRDGIRRAVISGMQIVAENNTTPVVTVTAANAAEPATNGTFTIHCNRVLLVPLTVAYTVGGSATGGADYYAEDLPGSIDIPAGASSATITVRPKSDGLVEGPETILLNVIARDQYVSGIPGGQATALVLADAAPPEVTVSAVDSSADELPGDTARLAVTRTGSAEYIANYPLTVRYALSGTATPGCDYARLPGSVTIPAGATAAQITLIPYEDPSIEGPETAILTLTADTAYTVGSPASAAITIADHGRPWAHATTLRFSGFAGTEPQVDFPVLVVLTPERIGEYVDNAPGGADLRFQLPNGDCLPYEIERWNPGGTSYVWVRVPLITSRHEQMTMWWGNPLAATMQDAPAVWSNGYVGVWHLDQPETGGGYYADSTGRGYHAVGPGVSVMLGRVAGAAAFEAAQGDYLDTNNREDLPVFTISAWVRSSAAADHGPETGPLHRGANYRLNWNHPQDGACVGLESTGWCSAPYGPLSGGTWYYLAGTYDGQTLKAYRDGVLVSSVAGPASPPASESNSLKFARHAALAQYFTGAIDEVQVTSVAWSEARMRNQYATLTDTLIAWRGPPSLDSDRDGDVDLTDFAFFQRCFSGVDRLLTVEECLGADVDGDHCVTADDLAEFIRCASGPGIAAAPDCLPLPD